MTISERLVSYNVSRPVEREEHGGESKLRGLEEILRGHDILDVDVDSGFVVVSPKSQTRLAEPDVEKELGSAGTYYRRMLGGEEYNTLVSGHNGTKTFDEMRRSDSTVRQSLRIAKTPVLAGRWFVESANPGDEEADEQSKFISKCLFNWMSISWFQFLIEALLMLDFGYYTFEKVFTVRQVSTNPDKAPQTRVVWKKFAPRHPLDVEEWEYDQHGGAQGAWFAAWDGTSPVWIPIEQLLVFSYDREAGNVEGISLLRSAWKHWYYKDNLYKIDAIQKERHGIGIPVIKLPPNFSSKDRELARELGRNLRTNERAYVVLPPMWELQFADIKGRLVDIASSIEHHDNAVVRNVLANFVGTETSAAATVQVELFLKATRFIADIIADVLNKYAIPELIDFNYPRVTDYPRLGVRRIGETADWRTLSFAIRNFIGAKVIQPDDELETWVRKEMDLPQVDELSTREVITPQLPRAGMPRQGPPSARQGQGTGEDKSGE
jgi:hypothetical protein